MKKAILFVLALVTIGIIALLVVTRTTGVTFAHLFDNRVRSSQIFSQERLLKEGDLLLEQGFYLQALAKYNQGLDQKYIETEEDKRGPIVRKMRYYRIIGDYESAHHQFIDAPKNFALERDFGVELKALVLMSSDNSNPVYEYIALLKQRHRESLPPVSYDPYTSIAVGTILRLYNTIGDHDAGIKFIDECMEFFKQQDIKKYGVYKPGHADEEYLKVRAAFERDKAEGFKGCGGKKPGEVCVGRATKALIESDYFPW